MWQDQLRPKDHVKNEENKVLHTHSRGKNSRKAKKKKGNKTQNANKLKWESIEFWGKKMETRYLRLLYCWISIESLIANILNKRCDTLWITWKLPRSVSTGGGHCKFAVRQKIRVGSPHYLKHACWYPKSATCKVCVCRVQKCSQCRVVLCHSQLRLRWCNVWAPGSFFI